VFDGNTFYTVVTAAKNTKKHLVTLLALPGSSLHGKSITSKDFFGIQSHGMLCSPKDLKIHPESGLVDLPPFTKLGTSLDQLDQVISSTPWYEYQLVEQFFFDTTINKTQGDLLAETYFFEDKYYYRSIFH
jgi:tRNA-binding EMAP/Myf-like protein